MYCAVAVNIQQKIKNCALIKFNTQYVKIILQKSRKTDYALVPLLKIKYRKKSTILTNKHHLISPAVHF